MNPGEESARQFLSVAYPLMVGWFLAGAVIAVLYHLSLFHLEGEFRTPGERVLDAFLAIARGLLYFVAWPFVFYFDRDALYRIKMYWLWLDPRQRRENQELRAYMGERWRRIEAREQFCEGEIVEKRRTDELKAGSERLKRLRVLHSDSAELDQIWLLCGIGQTPSGTRSVVRLHPAHMLPEEALDRVRDEIDLRQERRCLRCRAELAGHAVTLPDLLYLEVKEAGGEKSVVAGWALKGSYRVEFPACPSCGAEQPAYEADVTTFGRASQIVRALADGLSFDDGATRDELEPGTQVGRRRRVMRGASGLGTVVGLIGILGIVVALAALVWALWVFTMPFGGLWP